MDNDKRKHKCGSGCCLLVDRFEGALSDFADETVVDVYDTKRSAIREVKCRVHDLEKFHKDDFDASEIPPFPSDDDIVSTLERVGILKYVSGDGCKYTWQIILNIR